MDDWEIDLQKNIISHISGMWILFKGKPDTDYFEGWPENIPQNMNSLDVVRLIRVGFDVYRKAFQQKYDINPVLKLSVHY